MGAGNDEVYLRSPGFGAGIARHFLLPYNRKLWKTDLREMSADLGGRASRGSRRE